MPKIRGNHGVKWRLISLENGMRIFQEEQASHGCSEKKSLWDWLKEGQDVNKKSARQCFKAIAKIHADPYIVFKVLLDYGPLRHEWDPLFDRAEVYLSESFENEGKTCGGVKAAPSSDLVHLTLRAPPKFSSAAPRDAALKREWWQEDDVFVIVHRSVDSVVVPDALQGTVRAKIHGYAFVISPTQNTDACFADSPDYEGKSSIVMELLELNPGGWVSMSSYLSMEYQQDMLSQLAGLREMFDHLSLIEIKAALTFESLSKASSAVYDREGFHEYHFAEVSDDDTESFDGDASDTGPQVASDSSSQFFSRYTKRVVNTAKVASSISFKAASRGGKAVIDACRKQRPDEEEVQDNVSNKFDGNDAAADITANEVISNMANRHTAKIVLKTIRDNVQAQEERIATEKCEESSEKCDGPEKSKGEQQQNMATPSSLTMRKMENGKKTLKCTASDPSLSVSSDPDAQGALVASPEAMRMCPHLHLRPSSVPFGYNLRTDTLHSARKVKGGTELPNSFRNCWGEPHGKLFKIRGATYLDDRIKVQGSEAPMRCAGIDWFRSEKPIENVGEKPEGVVQSGILRGNPKAFCLIVNMQVPLGPSNHRSMACYFVTEDEAVTAEDTLFGRFIRGNENFQGDRFKFVPNVAAGPILVKKSVGNKPLIVRNALETKFKRGDRFFEVDINIGSSSVAYYVVKLVLGYVRNVVVDLAFLLEGQCEAELPEQILGTVRIARLEPNSPISFS